MTKEWFEKVAGSGLGWRTSKEATYDIAMLALQRGIPGDFVECGVYAGASSALMARAILDFAEQHGFGGFETADRPAHIQAHITEYVWNGKSFPRVHLFDSFQGMPEANPTQDPELWGSYGDKCKGSAFCPLPHVQQNMHNWGIPPELLVYHPGWFEQTIPPVGCGGDWDIRQIAVLRLDGDLYSSTKVCMQHLFPLVSPGGWIIVDDFNLSGCRQAVFEHVAPAPIYFRVPEKT